MPDCHACLVCIVKCVENVLKMGELLLAGRRPWKEPRLRVVIL